MGKFLNCVQAVYTIHTITFGTGLAVGHFVSEVKSRDYLYELLALEQKVVDRLSPYRDPDKTGICSHIDTIVFQEIDLWGRSAEAVHVLVPNSL